MEVIQQIGAYAGFAAIVGLAVLSALYFSQARDLKRLREWVARVDLPPSPRSEPRPRGPSRASDRAPQASSVATARGDTLAGEAPPSGSAPTGPAEGRRAATALSQAPAAQASATGAWGRSAMAAPPRRSTTAGLPASGAPARNAPSDRSPATGRLSERASSLRYVALAVVGALIVVGAGTFAVGLLGGAEEPGAGERAGTTGQATQQSPDGPAPPASVTFSVLNGTGVDGLAKQVADELEAAGYRRGNVTNATEQSAESAVLYAQGAREEALAVARRIDVSQTEPIDSASQALAGDASVVVMVGADQTQ